MLFIAEIGLNHNGNFDLACEMMRQAKLAGADIAKFQLGWRDKPDEMNHLDANIIQKFTNYAKFLDIELMFSVFHREALELLKPFEPQRYKIASRTVKDDLDYVKEVVALGKPTIISLGMWDGPGMPLEPTPNVDYLWCRSRYPSYPWDMEGFPLSFSNSDYTGYSDHTLGIETALVAISRGATIIERHFTLDKSDSTIRDHTLSSSPKEFAQLVEFGHAIARQVAAGL
jgi:N,N'-diacetyllegionaminate synthase